jgi:hypothetical protein
VALTAQPGVICPHNALPFRGSRCAGAGSSPDGGMSAGVVVRLPDAAATRVAPAERLAEVEFHTDVVAI